MDLDIGPPRDEQELARYADILVESLGFPGERIGVWFDRFGRENLRLARSGGAVVGGVGILRMGQWFGGRSIPTGGITAVAVGPEARSRGVGGALMRSTIVELRAQSVPLSTLYPATLPLYRSVGYETAGVRTIHRFTLPTLDAGDRACEVRLATPSDHEAMRAVYAERARRTNGLLDRCTLWSGIFDPIVVEKRHQYVAIGASGRIEGYIVYAVTKGAPMLEVSVRDLVAITPEAGRTLLSLLADHRSVAHKATASLGPGDPVLMLQREQTREIADRFPWMLRVVDAPAALAARGYSPHVRAEVHFEVRDALFGESARRIVLTVDGGRGDAREGGRGSVRVDVRALASLYASYASAEDLRVTGLVEGDDAELAKATAVFAGPAPWISDMF
jgi:predicted acetyltransferase